MFGILLLPIVAKLKAMDFGVASKGITYIPDFIRIHPLILKLHHVGEEPARQTPFQYAFFFVLCKKCIIRFGS
jgi:hypothetical protein